MIFKAAVPGPFRVCTLSGLATVVLLNVLLSVDVSLAIPIDNGVETTMVMCEQDSITVNFQTQNSFNGRIFVKGMSDKGQCVKSYTGASASSTDPSITFTFGDCNMQRSRTLAPQKGMMQAIVVIISFHRIFITKVDKAYRVQCFYMEAEKTVTSELEVSMLTTDDVRDTGAMPTCTYTVHRGSRDGPIVRYARIGEPVYHMWECGSDSHRLLVKSCFVDDGQGNKYEILDDNGCAIDAVILPDLTYESNVAVAWAEAHVFKFADRPTLYFQCTVQLCNRGESTCDAVTPPQCSSSGNRRRFFTGIGHNRRVARELPLLQNHGNPDEFPAITDDEVDLISNSIAVIDLEDHIPSSAHRSQQDSLDAAIHTFDSPEQAADFEEFTVTRNGICMSTTGFGMLLALVIVVFIVAAVIGCMLCYGRTRSKS